MKLIHQSFKSLFLTVLSLFTLTPALADNTTVTTTQITSDVTISNPVDYVVTSQTPFTEGAHANITNTEHAVLILKNVRPSVAESLVALHVRIDGASAVPGVNCTVKIYNMGSMIVPHGSSYHPLTVFSGDNCTGTSSNDFRINERISLSGNAMNNNIRSFTLKRGYMICLATNPDGTGYSRLYIADKTDRNVNLSSSSPALCGRVSFIRIQQWNDVNKRGFAGTSKSHNEKLRTTWCYGWNADGTSYDDFEYVTQHHHEGWPSINNVGLYGTSPNALGNNEPDNTGDERETVSSVDEVLANWPQMMATGKRLGSPAVASNLNWLYQFIDSIDARGWRCDFVAVHAYWYSDWSSWQSQLKAIYDRTKRPIWITEMNYGANWTGWPGSNTSGNSANYDIEYNHMKPIIDGLESTSYIERYAIYNYVQDCRMAVDYNGNLTKMGNYYANKSSNLAFNSSYGVTPKDPRMGGPSLTGVQLDNDKGLTTVSFDEPNGEFNSLMVLEKRQANNTWLTVDTVTLQESKAHYAVTVKGTEEVYYRVRTIDYKGKTHTSNILMAVPQHVYPGRPVVVNGTTYYQGGNLLTDGDFELPADGATTWTDGTGKAIGQPGFEIAVTTSQDDLHKYAPATLPAQHYLQSWMHTGSANPGALQRVVSVEAGKPYYFSVTHKNNSGSWQKLSLTTNGTDETREVINLQPSGDWLTEQAYFNTDIYNKVLLRYRWLGSKSQYDDFRLCQLFTTQDEALTDGLDKLKLRAQDFMARNTAYPVINTMLQQDIETLTTADSATVVQADSLIMEAITAYHMMTRLDSLASVTKPFAHMNLPGGAQLLDTYDTADALCQATLVPDSFQYIAEACSQLQQAFDLSLKGIDMTRKVSDPQFTNKAEGWLTKAGTFTGGDQNVVNQRGNVNCWNAWWGGVAASSDQTLMLKQEIKGATFGFYWLSTRATTQHHCLTDQHAFITADGVTVTSPTLTYDRLDYPDIDDKEIWQSLTTRPVYLSDADSLTIGFCSSKAGAVDNAWRRYASEDDAGDRREGWWCATDFQLHYIPAYQLRAAAKSYTTVCLPFRATAPECVSVYEVAAISTDGTKLFLTPVTRMLIGKPYIVYMTDTIATFTSTATTFATSVRPGANNLKGVFGNQQGTTPLSAANYILKDGTWVKVKDGENVTPTSYSAYLTTTEDIPVADDAYEVWLPIEADVANGISTVTEDAIIDQNQSAAYSINGTRITRPDQHQGIMIKQGQKIVRKR